MISINRRRSILATTVGLVLLAFLLPSSACARERLIIIGTATKGGVFYPIGVELCKIINKAYIETGVRCVPAITDGALYNLMALRTGEIDIALTTAYVVESSFSGQEMFYRYGPDPNLRQIARLYSTPVNIIVPRDKVSSINELKGKRFAIGLKGGAKNAIGETLLRKLGWSASDIKFVQQFQYQDDQVVDEFCKGKLDGLIMMFGMPSAIYDKAINKCNGEILDMPQDLTRQLIAEHPALTAASIPPGIYNHSSKAINTLANNSVLVASSETPWEIVALVHAALKDNLPNLKATFEGLDECRVDAEYFKNSRIPVHEAIK